MRTAEEEREAHRRRFRSSDLSWGWPHLLPRHVFVGPLSCGYRVLCLLSCWRPGGVRAFAGVAQPFAIGAPSWRWVAPLSSPQLADLIIAIFAGRLLEVSLGYYLNPLINVLIALIFLGERLSRLQWIGVTLAALGVANLTLRYEGFPWISLGLALCFGFYGLIRKQTRLGPRDGLFLETLLMLPLALAFLIWLQLTGESSFLASGSREKDLLIAASGIITAVPLIWFAAAARRLAYATIGVMQYIAPTLHFLLAIRVFGEDFTRVHAVTFTFIWLGVACFTLGSLDGFASRIASRWLHKASQGDA